MHYKALFYARDEFPLKKARKIFEMFGITNTATFKDDYVPSLLTDLLSSNKLAPWVFETTSALYELTRMLMGSPFWLKKEDRGI